MLADFDANVISTDKLAIPSLIVNSPQSTVSLICYPNPFNNITNIKYTLPEDANGRDVIYYVSTNIYNVLGEKVGALVTNERQQAGQYTVKFDGTNLRQGVYYCKIEATNSSSAYTKTNIMMIAR